jgi:SAM-dependent methyltransferase
VNYERIFEQRGGAYDRAMQRWPEARRGDFDVALRALEPRAGETIVDVPAGGDYLRRWLPPSCRWFGHEPCAGFHPDAPTPGAELLPLPWPDGFADAAVSVAGVHHLADKRPLFRELRRVVRVDGRFVLADVHEDSAVASFLDAFVGAHNSTGHAGIYLGGATLGELLETGWRVEQAARVAFEWRFADRSDLAAFCRMLFDLQDVTDAAVLAGVERHLGVTAHAGGVGMNWELFVVRASAR